MKLFEFYGKPTGNEEEILFEIKAEDSLKKELSKEWIGKLNEEVLQSFVEIMSKKDSKDDVNYSNFLKIGIIGRTDAENNINFETNLYQRDVILDIVENFNNTQKAIFNNLSNKFTQEVTDLFVEYLEAILNLEVFSTEENKDTSKE